MACSFEMVRNETTLKESGFDRASEFFLVWDRHRSGRWESRETAALRLGTAHAVGDSPRRIGTGGIRICRDYDFGQKRRAQNRRFAKSEHMTPSSVSSA